LSACVCGAENEVGGWDDCEDDGADEDDEEASGCACACASIPANETLAALDCLRVGAEQGGRGLWIWTGAGAGAGAVDVDIGAGTGTE